MIECRICTTRTEPVEGHYVVIFIDEGSEPDVGICCLHCALNIRNEARDHPEDLEIKESSKLKITLLDGTPVNIDLCYINWVMHCNMIREWQAGGV
tara:strand:- start:195 stop:482 length:288 start_codon:yes stop_codon:yes gene_type:complete